MTATTVIRQLEKLPARERRKVFAYVDSVISPREDEEDRKALAAVRGDRRPPRAWKDVKARLRLT